MGTTDNTNYLAGNPIFLNIYTGANSTGRYRIYTGSDYATLLYDGSASSVSGIAKVDVTSLFADLKTVADVLPVKMVTVDAEGTEHADGANSEYVYKFVVFSGGISKALTRRLMTLETDIFTWKLKNSATNFFLSTRTNGSTIQVPENELLPLFYYTKGLKFYLKADNELVETYDYSSDTADSLESIDFANIRSLLVESNNKLYSIFSITNDAGHSCQVMITEATKTDYFLKFKNSWGVWEKIALNGDVSFTPIFVEVVKTSKWDDLIGDFVERNERKQLNNSFTSGLGYKTEAERLFVIDMLFSGEVVLIACDQEYEVNVSADMAKIISTDGVPVDVSLTIELIDKETNFSDLSAIEIAPNMNDKFEYSLPFNLV